MNSQPLRSLRDVAVALPQNVFKVLAFVTRETFALVRHRDFLRVGVIGPQGVLKSVNVDRLSEVVRRAQAHGLNGRSDRSISGQDHDSARGSQSFDLWNQDVAVLSAQPQVQNDEHEGPSMKMLQGGLGIARFFNTVTPVFKLQSKSVSK